MSENSISDITRHDVIDYLLLSTAPFHGKLDLINFIARIWDLASMPSTDSRFTTAEQDIWQHMINNGDWSYDYLLCQYLGLITCDDSEFLKFLELCVHPRVVADKQRITDIVGGINEYLMRDNYQLSPSSEISGWPIYKACRIDDSSICGANEMTGSGFPFDSTGFMHTLIEVMMNRGRAREVALLAFAGDYALEKADNHGWDRDVTFWQFVIRVTPRVYAPIPKTDITESETAIEVAANELLKGNRDHTISRVSISAAITQRAGIYDEALKWLNGTGLTNQGRVRTNNIAAREEDGLLFRSLPEIFLYKALKETGVTLAPLPVFLRGGDTYQRIEPDFILFKDKALMVVEVDGDTVHKETPAEADYRLRLFKHEGAIIERVRASACDTLEKARVCASHLLQVIDKITKQR